MSTAIAKTMEVGSLDRTELRTATRFSRGWKLTLIACDVAMFVIAIAAAISVLLHFHYVVRENGVIISAAIAIGISIVVFERLGLYRRSFAFAAKDEFYYTVVALIIGFAPQLIVFTLVHSISTSRIVLLTGLVFSVITVGGMRALAHAYLDVMSLRRTRSVAVVGAVERVEKAAAEFKRSGTKGIIKIAVDDFDAQMCECALNFDAECRDVPWFREACERGAELIVLTEAPEPHVVPYLLNAAARHNMRIVIAPPRIVAHSYSVRVMTQGAQVLILTEQLGACREGNQLVKRIVDVSLASIALIVFLPIMLIAALAVYLESGFPIIFRQVRIGRFGREFEILKFRSMPLDAEAHTGAVWTVPGDTRATRVGAFLRRTSIDELPQVFNVLRGEMSIVGPRPERPIFVEQFRRQLPRYDERHLVRPGITGWSHIHMKRSHGQSEVGERLRLDLFYIENWSLYMDLSIVFKTAAELPFHRAV